jgi:hypothetical protein
MARRVRGRRAFLKLARRSFLFRDFQMTIYQDKSLETLYGVWKGTCLPEHGHSRAHQNQILTAAGGVIFTVETPKRIKIGARVAYQVGFDASGIEALAVNVVEPGDIAPEVTLFQS